MKGVASLTRRFFNNSIQTHTFFETDVGACQANSGRVVPVYWRSNWRLLEAEAGIEPTLRIDAHALKGLVIPGDRHVNVNHPARPLADRQNVVPGKGIVQSVS